MVQTVDFITPIIDEPYLFGQITAANALSDIYAMGVDPSIVLNIVSYPCELGMEILTEILRGGLDKVTEAGAMVAGGHTIDDKEPKFGMAVTGFAKPSEITYVSTAKPGDYLILTKPLGIGILATAIKGKIISSGDIEDALKVVMTLNKDAKDCMKKFQVSACTDVTGFGLLGHLHEMISASGVGAEVWINEVAVWEKALDFAKEGIMPGGLQDNKRHLKPFIEKEGNIDSVREDILYDPQTSGGLLIAVSEKDNDLLLKELKIKGIKSASIVGKISASKKPHITIK